MNDAEYIFKATERERKRLGYGDKHKKRGGGRFVRLPSDTMSTAITLLRQKYGVRTPELSAMFGCSPATVKRENARLGVAAKRGGTKVLNGDAWQAFLMRGKATNEQKAEQKEEQKQEANPVIIENGPNIAAIISALVGTGAKLTIEVTL